MNDSAITGQSILNLLSSKAAACEMFLTHEFIPLLYFSKAFLEPILYNPGSVISTL